jgi:hypothetical protein
LALIRGEDKFEIFEHSTYMIIRLNKGITLKISSVAMTNLLVLLISVTNTFISASFADATSSIIPIEINGSQGCGCQQHDILSKPHGWIIYRYEQLQFY